MLVVNCKMLGDIDNEAESDINANSGINGQLSRGDEISNWILVL